MEHSALSDLIKPIKDLHEDVKRKALTRLEYEGLTQCEDIKTPGKPFYNDPAGYAMNRYAYYPCAKCKKAYYGGAAQCEANNFQDEFNPDELVSIRK